MLYAGIAIAVIIILGGIIYTARRNNEIRQSGIETEAKVTRIEVSERIDPDGTDSRYTTYYVTYRSRDGQTVEAKLGSGRSFDNYIKKKPWDHDLYEGCPVIIKYLPEKPDYVIRIG